MEDTESELPNELKSNTENVAPTMPVVMTLTLLPKRTNELAESELPKCMLSSTLADNPT
jgi:hypothetical protein